MKYFIFKEIQNSQLLQRKIKDQEDELVKKNQKIARFTSKMLAVKEIVTRLDPEDDTPTLPVIVKVESVDSETDNKTISDIDETELLTPLPVIVCAECDKKFAHVRGLKQHMLLHQIPKFACPMCPLKFVRADYVQRHIHKAHKRVLESSRKTRARQYRN